MQYGSIGWSVGATLGYAQSAKDKRVIACIGDGSFQVSNMILRYCWEYDFEYFRIKINSEFMICFFLS